MIQLPLLRGVGESFVYFEGLVYLFCFLLPHGKNSLLLTVLSFLFNISHTPYMLLLIEILEPMHKVHHPKMLLCLFNYCK